MHLAGFACRTPCLYCPHLAFAFMLDLKMQPHPPPSFQDHWIATPEGRLFARRWTPAAAAPAPDHAPAPALEPSPAAPAAAPIVLLHDSLGCVELWRDFAPQLAQATGRDVIAYDRLGFGRSDPHPGRLALDFIHSEAHGGFAALCRQLHLAHCALLGHSVGGAMAAVCAAEFPAICQALVTESAQAFVEERTLSGIAQARDAFARPGELQRLHKYHGDKAPWVLDAWVGTWLHPDFRHWSLDTVLAQVQCPVLALHGANDEYGSAQQPQRFASLPAGPATLQLLPGCGHVPHREQSAAMLQAVQDFLAP